MARRAAKGRSRKKAVVTGALIGALLGYPVSYWLQPGMLRAKLSFGDYFAKIGEVLSEGEFLTNVILGVVIMAVVGAILGAYLSRR